MVQSIIFFTTPSGVCSDGLTFFFFSQLHGALLQQYNQLFFSPPLSGVCSDGLTFFFFHKSAGLCSDGTINYFFHHLRRGFAPTV